MIFTEEDGKKYHVAANLVKLKDLMFLALFLDPSVLQKQGPSTDKLLPDAFWKVDQIEPKLLLRAFEYNQLAEKLIKDPKSLRQPPEKPDYAVEGVPVQPGE
ncbi:MAG: hypothetical protein ACYTBJ_16455 [Planctomycetota bacterium]